MPASGTSALDLNWPEARDIVARLCVDADVIVENFRPGTLARFGFGYDDVAKFNPGIVYVSISGYGQTGPWRNRPAFAPTVHAETGLTDILQQHYEGAMVERRNDACSHADVYTGLQGVIAVLAALQHRSRTGEGQYVDVSMAATMLSANERAGAQLSGLDVDGEPYALSANESPIFELPDGRRLTIATSPVFSPMFIRYCSMMYTLFMASSASLAVNPLVYRKLAYDPDSDFAPVSLVATAPLVMVVGNSTPATRLKELIPYIRSREGRFAYASTAMAIRYTWPAPSSDLWPTSTCSMCHTTEPRQPWRACSPATRR